MKQTIMFDIDGVLADFSYGFRALARVSGFAPEIRPYSHTDPRHEKWDWPDLTGEALAKTWDAVRRSGNFWYNLPPLVNRVDVKRIQKLAIPDPSRVFFVTARKGLNVKFQTAFWLRDVFGILDPSVIVSADKGDTALDIGATYSIDDKAGNAVYVAYRTKGATKSYIIDRPYNRFDHDVLGSKVTRVSDLSEFLDDVEAGA